MSSISFEARFFDGETAKPHRAVVELYRTVLRIKTDGDSQPKDWLYKDIKVLEQPVPPLPARLTSVQNSDMRLYVEPEDWTTLKTRLPKTAFPRVTLSTNWKSLLGYTGLSIAFVLGTVFLGPKLFEQAGGLIPQETEMQIGKMAIESSIDDPVCVAPQGQAALEKMVHSLKQGMSRDIPFNVRVISDDEMLNALAAPGGYLVIFSGILKNADTAKEVAGVLAHEMAHIEMNHPMKSLMRNLGVTLTLQMMFGDARAIGNAAHFAGMMNQLHYSREDEMEADAIGQALLEKANIDPAGLSLFFERIRQEETAYGDHGGHWPHFEEYFSTHPQTEKRINQLKLNESGSQTYQKVLNDSEWQALKAICSKQTDFK